MSTGIDELVASLLQIIVLASGAVWFLFLERGLQRGRHLSYMAYGWLFMAAMYIYNAAFLGILATTGIEVSPNARSVSDVVDSTLSLFSSAALFMAWYLMRDGRVGQRTTENAANPTMSKGFVVGIATSVASAISAYIIFVGFLLDKPALKLLFAAIDVTAAAVAGILIGWELWRSRFVDIPGNTRAVGAGSFARIRGYCLVVFSVWGASQFLHLASLMPEPLEGFTYPTGTYYDFLAVLKVMCAAGAGVVALHTLPERSEFRHGPS